MRKILLATTIFSFAAASPGLARNEPDIGVLKPNSQFQEWLVSQVDPPKVETPPAPADGQTPPATEAEPVAPEEDVLPNLEAPGSEDEMSIGEIPTVEVIELNAEQTRKAIDAYVLVTEKYKDAELENYENLQDFVDRNEKGKAFEADIKGFGFNLVNDWSVAITTIGFAYANIINDQTTDIKQQIEEVKADTEIAQDMRDRMVAALNAMIPSDNNKKIVEDLMKDVAYAEKLKLLETEEE
jgi:hypothetical protein